MYSLVSYSLTLSKKVLWQIIILLCLFLGSCNLTSNPSRITTTAQVTRVISGQTIEVVFEQPDRPQRVRIIGIDVPKLDHNQERTKIRLQKLIGNTQVNLELESSETDRYERLLAHVWYGDVLVSEQLAKEGYVIANNQYSHKYSDRLFYAQEYARILGYGIWH